MLHLFRRKTAAGKVAAGTAILLSFGLAYAEDPVVLDEIVAKVNHEIITLTDLQRELNLLRSGLEEQFRDPQQQEQVYEQQKRALLRSIIENKMMLQRAEELGLAANIDTDVAAFLEETRKQAGIPNMEVLDQVLRQRGSSLAQYRESIKQRMIIESLLGQFVYSKLTVLTPEIEAYYQRHIDQFTEPEEVELAEILLLTEGKEKDQVRTRTEEALQRLRNGAPFEEVAREFSEGPTASRGGGIGTFRRGSMAAPLEAVVFELEEGQTTNIIETDYGLQIVKVLERQPTRVKPLEEVRLQIQTALYESKAGPELQSFLENLRDESYIYIAPKYQEEFDVEGL